MIEEYSVVTGFGRLAFTRAVNEAIADGWQPFGNMTMMQTGEDLTFYQPIVRYADHEA